MFKSIQSPSINNIKNGTNLPSRQSLDFALAEFSSAIEMLQAAKLVDSRALCKGFMNHALDEYRHTEFFRRLLKSSHDTELKFDPRLSIALGFINPENFLFEANDLPQFTAFVAINEASALRMFSKIRPAIDGTTDELKNEIEDIIDDETEHLRSFTKNPTENAKYSDSFVYEMLLLDEERHAGLSAGFLEKIASPRKRVWLRLRYKIGNKLRHFWGAQRRVQHFVDKSISILVISLLLPFRRALKFPVARKENLICRENGKFLL